MHADIAGSDRAEDRVGQRVQPDIGIRMTDDPGAVRDLDAAHHQAVAGPERVHVETLADTHITLPRRDQPLGRGEVIGRRHLQVRLAAGNDQRRDPGRLGDRGIVGQRLPGRLAMRL